VRAYEQKRTEQDLAARIAQAEASGVDWTKSLSDQDLVNIFGSPGVSPGSLTVFGQAKSAGDPGKSSGQIIEQADGSVLLTNVGPSSPSPNKKVGATASPSARRVPTSAVSSQSPAPASPPSILPKTSVVAPRATAAPPSRPPGVYTSSARRSYSRNPNQISQKEREKIEANLKQTAGQVLGGNVGEAIGMIAAGNLNAADLLSPPGVSEFAKGIQSIYETDQSQRTEAGLRFGLKSSGLPYDRLQPATVKQLSPTQLKSLYSDGVITEAAYESARGGQ
jgi:hypothetical protein